MIDLGEDEVPLFRHRAQCKSREGEVVVTSVRFSFLFSEGNDHKNFTWACISGVKYSPPTEAKGRAMVLLKTTVKGDEDVVITLLGSSKEKNFAELETLKSVVSKVRKGKGSGAPVKPEGAAAADAVGTKRVAEPNDAVDIKRRRQLLEHDRHLAKQYRDLVEVSKILTDEDFWASYAHHTLQVGDFRPGEYRKGKQNSLLAEAFSKDANGVINIRLTLEMTQNIFAMYPEVRRAFEAEVPLKCSETEFWTMYFRSEFYNSSGAKDAHSTENAVRDDLFARYAEQEGHQATAKRKLGGQIHFTDIDLTATFGDYRAPEHFDADGTDLQKTENLVSARYNRNSALVLGGGAGDKTSTAALGKAASSSKDGKGRVGLVESLGTELTELIGSREPGYIRVHMQPPASSAGTQAQSQPAAAAAPSSSAREAELRRQYEAIAAALATPALPSAPARTGLPTAERGGKYFQNEVSKMRKQARRMTGEREGAVDSGRAGGGNIMGMLGIEEDGGAAGEQYTAGDDAYREALLDDQLKQVRFNPYSTLQNIL
jgi:hypothetical protein